MARNLARELPYLLPMMRTLYAMLFLALSPGVAEGQILDGRLSGLAFGDGVEAARTALSPVCRSIRTIKLDAPRLPLAAERESARARVWGDARTDSRDPVPQCARSVEFEISPPNLSTQPEKQIQIDCLGFPYAGYTRKVEAVFGNGRLALVWILTGKPEEPRVRDALIAAYGDPITIGDDYDEFGDGSVLLRKDKPEVLFLSPELAAARAEQEGR